MATSLLKRRREILIKWGMLLLLVTPLLTSDNSYGEEWEWSADAGFNYDFISHDYYLLTVDTLGLSNDSLQELRLYSDRIDEKGVNLRLALEHDGTASFTIANRVFVADEKIRDLLSLRLEWGMLRVNTETDLKSYTLEDEFSLYDDRLQNRSRLSLAILNSNRWRIELSEEFEYSGYNNPSSSIFGYRQYETRLRLLRDLADFSQIDLTLRFDHREAYDSTALDFNRFIVEGGIDQIGSSLSYQANLFLERKNYSLANSEDDYSYVSPYFDLDWSLSEQWAVAPRFEAHYYRYDTQELATFSHLRTDLEALLEYRYTFLSKFKVGMGHESFTASSDEYNEQDYQSVMGIAGFESLASTAFTISLDSELGHRNYGASDSSFYSDHWFLRFDLYADWRIAESLRFSVIGGTDFEYHDQKEDDSFLYLISTNISYEIH